MEEKQNLAKEALKALTELEETVRMEDLIKNNIIEFVVDKETYRVRKPTYIERQELDTARRKKYLELVKDASFLFRKQWIDQYKSKGIDILEMENKVKNLNEEIKTTLLRLAKSQEPKDISQLKQDVLNLKDDQFATSIEITDLLSHSIENQILIYVNSYTTYLVLEKKVGEEWQKAFDSYDDFMKSESKVIPNAFYYINVLIYNYGIENESSTT